MNPIEVRTDAFAWRSAVSILLFIALWEIAARIHVAPAILLPPFSIVAAQLWYSTLDGTLAALGFPSPKIAFIPIFILWFGIESLSKILLVTFACIFPIIIGTYSAARAVSRQFVWSALSLGSSRSGVFFHVILPACYPRIFTTFRIAVPVGLITTFTAEMVAGGGGMGATLIYSQRFFESPTVFAYIVVMLCVGLVLDSALLSFQRRFLGWAEN